MSKIYSTLRKVLPTPRFMSMDPVALEISPRAIRIMKMKEKGNNFLPVFFREVVFNTEHNLEDSDISEGEINSVVSVLKKLRYEHKFKNVVATLPDYESYVYRTEISREAIGDIDSAIKFGLEENVPHKASEVKFSYCISSVNNDVIEVVVSVFLKKVIKVYTDIIKKAGMVPISFIPESTAVANSVIKHGDTKPYLLIKIMEDYTNVSIVSENVVQYTSKISVEGAKLESPNDSLEAKKLSQELNKTLIFWFTTNSGLGEPQKIQDALLVGKYSPTEGLVDYLENSLKIDVELGNAWSNCFSLEDYIPKMFKEKSLEFTCPIGLSLESLKFK